MAKDPVNIFVVENNKLFVDMLEYIFTKESAYRFIDFNNGEDCLRNLHLEPDIVLLDLKLPGIDGHETLIQIKKHSPDASVFMMLDQEEAKAPVELLNSGAIDCLFKQNGVNSIIDRLEDHLRSDGIENAERRKPPLRIIKD